MKRAFYVAFPKTIPVMAGYVFLGIAYGLLLNSIGYGPLWALVTSVVIYSGTAQFLLVSLLSTGAPLLQVAILTFILSFRHFFYGLSMISRYRDKGGLKAYLIYALSDETYAILVGSEIPENTNDKYYCFAVTIMDQIYWIIGSVIGATAGGLLTIDLTGIDFAMTALFAVLVVEQWKSRKSHIPAITGFFVTVIAIVVLGPDNFLIPSLIAISTILLLLQERVLKKEEAPDECINI